ncbi:hypothetical protein N0V88_006981 [Collariella sp. IMI 366227]|nr:hypothetical protein N0V88_006981 [Collariella sp. IMI 366227]
MVIQGDDEDRIRLRLGTPKLAEVWVAAVKTKILALPSLERFYCPAVGFPYVLYARLLPAERGMLEAAVREDSAAFSVSSASAADGDVGKELVEQVAALVFLQFIYEYHSFDEAAFWYFKPLKDPSQGYNFDGETQSLNEHLSGLTRLLAKTVIKNYKLMLGWPVHEAAAHAVKIGTKSPGPEFHFIGTWFDNFLATRASSLPHKVSDSESEINEETETFVKGDLPGEPGKLLRLPHSNAFSACLTQSTLWRLIARYDLPEYKICPIVDKTIVRSLLECGTLEDDGNWILAYLEQSKQGHLQEFDHHHQVFYISKHVNIRYLEKCVKLPGQTLQCACFGTEPGDSAEDKAPCHGHGKGGVVHARRKLSDTQLDQSLYCFWVDWNDCRLILGRGTDQHGNLINGIAHAGRPVLQRLMGSEYHPRFNDFGRLIDHREFDFEKAELLGHT